MIKIKFKCDIPISDLQRKWYHYVLPLLWFDPLKITKVNSPTYNKIKELKTQYDSVYITWAKNYVGNVFCCVFAGDNEEKTYKYENICHEN